MLKPGVNLEKLQGLIIQKFGSQTAFAEACGVSRQYISRVVMGDISPSLARLVQFSELLGVTVDELLEKEEALVTA